MTVSQLTVPDVVPAWPGAVLDEVERAVVGKRTRSTLVLAGILAGGHVLLEDLPGLGKTLAARSLRPDAGARRSPAPSSPPTCCPPDLTGSFIYDQRRASSSSARGPLFTGLLLADEINRTPPKTQAALLEAMQEHQVTVEGQTFPLPAPFHVLATANPVEYEGTYPLPEAQLDRFLMRVSFGYPTADEECDVLPRRLAAPARGAVSSRRSSTPPGCSRCRPPSRPSIVDESSAATASRWRRRPATTRDVLMGASPRGSLGAAADAPGRTPSSTAATT